MNNAIDHFRTAIQDEGTTPPVTIIGDGNLHRYEIDGKLSGCYVLHLDGIAAGSFGDWKQGIKVIWKMAGNFKPLSDADRIDFAIESHRQAQVRKAEENARIINLPISGAVQHLLSIINILLKSA
jgi:putative DNA primase/helicase